MFLKRRNRRKRVNDNRPVIVLDGDGGTPHCSCSTDEPVNAA
jgi:hypothetical protein